MNKKILIADLNTYFFNMTEEEKEKTVKYFKQAIKNHRGERSSTIKGMKVFLKFIDEDIREFDEDIYKDFLKKVR